jgi:hypothetical protein
MDAPDVRLVESITTRTPDPFISAMLVPSIPSRLQPPL